MQYHVAYVMRLPQFVMLIGSDWMVRANRLRRAINSLQKLHERRNNLSKSNVADLPSELSIVKTLRRRIQYPS